MKNKVKRIQGIEQHKNIVLEQGRDLIANEKWNREHNELSAGIYEGSECVGVGISSDRFYSSGAMRSFSESVSIPLADTEVLVSLRDLLDEAVKISPDYQELTSDLDMTWSAGIYRSHNDPRSGWNHFVTVIADSEEDARQKVTDELLTDWNSRKLWDAWVDGGKHVRNRRSLLESRS